jgi:UDP-N-acetylmuramoyl-L-alanyl-D-glutamate--2,6-diaminopimelate ligase
MLLQSLLKKFNPNLPLGNLKNINITGVRDDSRRVRPGDLFVARCGSKADGRQYVLDAASRGAVAVLTPSRIPDCPIPQLILADTTTAVSPLANLFFENPSQIVQVLGVTGTNGKTTTTYLIRHILAAVNKRCGMIGTVELDDGRTRREATMTTPGAVEVAELLGTMRDKGCWACAMEVSSHALDQSRVSGVNFAGAAFTNLTGDHLDYHQTMENYASAKARLFEQLDADAVAVMNANDEHASRMVKNSKARVITFGVGRKTADYRATDVQIDFDGSHFVLDSHGHEAPVHTPMIGRHNIANALTAAALVGEVFHLSVQQIADALKTAHGAPGRLECIRAGQGFGVFVDYAHTDDGLENVLSALRPLTTTGKLRVLFGCGGDRDNSKRSRMAKVAERLADVVYVTSDNPRTEHPGAIIDEICSGFTRKSGKPVIVEADRRCAIERVLNDAGDGDIVLLAGKGHENYQIIGTDKRHFDDVEEARKVLERRTSTAAA